MKIQPPALSLVVLSGLFSLAACKSVAPVAEYDGAMLYKGYCASCHGATGAGDGPFAESLLVPLPDLHTIQARNNGVFPRESLQVIVRGEGLRHTHGAYEMPVWGWAFNMAERRMGEKDPGPFAEARIKALIDYLEEMQTQP